MSTPAHRYRPSRTWAPPALWPALLVLATLWLGGCPGSVPESVPDDFAVHWWRGPTHADRGPQRFINVTATPDGAHRLTFGERYRFISKQDGRPREQVTVQGERALRAAETLALYRLLLARGVPALESRHVDANLLDGDVQRLRVVWRDVDKRITAINTEPDALQAVRKHLEKLAASTPRSAQDL